MAAVAVRGGFTLIEVIFVLILVGILAAVLVMKAGGPDTDAAGEIALVKSRLRYAQTTAMNTYEVWGVRSTGSAYWLFSDGSVASKVPFPGETGDDVAAGAGVMEAFTIAFDDLGVPYTDAGATDPLAAGDPEASLTVAGQAGAVTITPGTGYIP
jgi:prepilin-type N-terminal cleavage/methylation domain-containing protein